MIKLWDIIFLLMTYANPRKKCYYSIGYEWINGENKPILKIRVNTEIVQKLEALEEGHII